MPRLTSLVVLCALVCLSASCGGSKPPQQKTTVLSTEYQDRDVGEDAAASVRAQMGILDDPALSGYVKELGRRLVRHAPRRAFEYQFDIIDQAEPNAFALPGGQIFISRGLLTLANTEDELAGVMGHEIIHAANRHASAQQEMQRRQNPLSMPYIKMGRIAAYGRENERDADNGGQIIAARAGFDPMGLSTFLESLGQVERLQIGHSRLPGFFDTHPGTIERAATTAAHARELGVGSMRPERVRTPEKRAAYVPRIDGLALGVRPSEGVFRGSTFLHADMNFHLRFPNGWRLSNTHKAVGAQSPKLDAVIFLEVDGPGDDPQAAAERFVAQRGEQMKLEVKKAGPVKLGEIDGYRIEAEAFTGTNVTAMITFVPYSGVMFRLVGAAPRLAAQRYLGRFRNAARTFGPLTDEERASIHGIHASVVTAGPGEDLPTLAGRVGNVWNPSQTGVLNGYPSDVRFEGGEIVKIARSVPYAPQPVPVESGSISR